MLVISIIIGFVGPLSELWYHIDYWRPEIFLGKSIGLEDYLFGFSMSGIASVIYPVLFNLKTLRTEGKRYGKKIVVIIALASTAIFNILMFGFGLNSIYASTLGMIAVASAIICKRKNLIIVSCMSGILMSVTFFLEYMIMLGMYPLLFERWWFLANLSGITVRSVPIEELLWAFALGMLLGPIYEFFSGTYIERPHMLK